MRRGEERFRVIKRLERLDLALGVGARQPHLHSRIDGSFRALAVREAGIG
jgi:hypothetical protein